MSSSGYPITLPKRIEVKRRGQRQIEKPKVLHSPCGVTQQRVVPTYCMATCSRVGKTNRVFLQNCARGVTTYRKTFLEMSKALFEKEFMTHSIRRSAARSEARCGADDSTMKRAGPCRNSVYFKYTFSIFSLYFSVEKYN
ncbi:uncharacterized protein LOC144635429 [Oculina patagonica]